MRDRTDKVGDEPTSTDATTVSPLPNLIYTLGTSGQGFAALVYSSNQLVTVSVSCRILPDRLHGNPGDWDPMPLSIG